MGSEMCIRDSKLTGPSTVKKITYINETNWSQDKLIIGANGIAALTFAEVEIARSPQQ